MEVGVPKSSCRSEHCRPRIQTGVAKPKRRLLLLAFDDVHDFKFLVQARSY